MWRHLQQKGGQQKESWGASVRINILQVYFFFITYLNHTIIRRCKTYHDKKRGCYIQNLTYNEENDHPYRVVVFDFECTQERQVVPGQLRYEHEVNFICANVVCTECIQSGLWNEPLQQPCQICGEHRVYAWSKRDFTETTVDKKFIVDNPLNHFVKWLLFNDFNPNADGKRYRNMCLSHFGVIITLNDLFIILFRGGTIWCWSMEKSLEWAMD